MTQFTHWRSRIEAQLQRQLPAADTEPVRLHAAMQHACMGGGKRLRPLLTYASAELLGLPPEQVDAAAMAVELIHCYSLVHDDLPAMDNDDLRRGQPTCHRAFDVATAILAGDALQSLAFTVLAQDNHPATTAASRVRMLALLAQASGGAGMAGGQALDLAANNNATSRQQLETLHGMKTGALIHASVMLPCLAAPADMLTQQSLDQFARRIGLAFQVRDDVLDVIADTATLGKTQGKDSRHNKASFPALMGVDAAQQYADALQAEALAALQAFDQRANGLRALAASVVSRQY